MNTASLDPDVLGRILLLQSALETAPDEQRLAETLAHGLAGLPGADGCAVCLCGSAMATSGGLTLPEACSAAIAQHQSPVGCPDDCPVRSMEHCWRHRLPADYGVSGLICIRVTRPTRLRAYEPFLVTTGNLLALRVQNQRQALKLQVSVQELEHTVAQRTALLRESEVRLRGVIEHAPVGAHSYELQPGQQLILVGANRAADQILRIEHFHILGRPIEEAFPGLVGTDIPNAYRQLAAQGGHLEREEVQYHHGQIEGAYHIHAFATGPNRMTVFFRDITERKRVERALVESQERYRLLIERSPDAIMIIQGDKLVFANPAALCLLGARSGEDLLGLTSEQVVHPEDRPAARDRVKRLATGESGLYPAEVRFLRRDGTDVWVEVIGTLIEYAGQPAVQLVARDISERKQAEAEREKLQGQLTQAQKMESVGRLAGGVAHDFNNMLQVILGNTALALTEVSADSPLRECLEEIQSSAQRSADLTRQLLAFARKQTIAPKVVDLNTAVAGMLKMLRRLIGEGIELAWLPGPDLGFVHVDPSQVDQILANLCVNARDAITSGLGKVTLETANVTIDEASLAEHPDARAGEYVRLSVSDNGCGLNPEVRAHLFEPFFTTKGLGQGTGLGLATVYGIVRQNNGFIIVSSEPGRGSTFLIHLPRHLPKILHSLQSTAPVPGGGQETILLVEDEPAILRVTRRLLEDLGYKVLAASTPGEGIQIAREHVGEIHLLLTDVVMPEMNGRDLARSLLGQYPNLKRLFMSGHTADVIAHHGVLDPGVHFIQKPYSVQVLADKVREALNRDG